MVPSRQDFDVLLDMCVAYEKDPQKQYWVESMVEKLDGIKKQHRSMLDVEMLGLDGFDMAAIRHAVREKHPPFAEMQPHSSANDDSMEADPTPITTAATPLAETPRIPSILRESRVHPPARMSMRPLLGSASRPVYGRESMWTGAAPNRESMRPGASRESMRPPFLRHSMKPDFASTRESFRPQSVVREPQILEEETDGCLMAPITDAAHAGLPEYMRRRLTFEQLTLLIGALEAALQARIDLERTRFGDLSKNAKNIVIKYRDERAGLKLPPSARFVSNDEWCHHSPANLKFKVKFAIEQLVQFKRVRVMQLKGKPYVLLL